MNINLPNNSVWDTTKSPEQQEKSALEYAYGMTTTEKAVVDVREECGQKGSGVFRWVKRHFDDTSNNLRIIQIREYMYPTSNKACFAVSKHRITIESLTI